MSSAAQELVLDAFEAAIGPNGPNPLHHRIEHAVQVTDEELARMVALDLPIVIHPDGEPDWIMYDDFLADFDRDNPPADIEAEVAAGATSWTRGCMSRSPRTRRGPSRTSKQAISWSS
jgi:predicted amidohydrolase YtcJ